MSMYPTIESNKRFTKVIFLVSFCILILVGCQSNNLFDSEVEITSIEVQDFSTEETIAVITDSLFIDTLVEDLETAASSSTDNMDIMSPEYNLLFLDSEETIIQELGYYIDEKDFGVIGSYHSRQNGEHYAVTTELPLENAE